jgi:hypothetical protein
VCSATDHLGGNTTKSTTATPGFSDGTVSTGHNLVNIIICAKKKKKHTVNIKFPVATIVRVTLFYPYKYWNRGTIHAPYVKYTGFLHALYRLVVLYLY